MLFRPSKVSEPKTEERETKPIQWRLGREAPLFACTMGRPPLLLGSATSSVMQ